MVIWTWLAGFLITGYLTFGRPFGYLGIPPLFIGEIALGAFLLLKPRVGWGTWAASSPRSSPLKRIGLALLVFVAFGVWQVGRGVLAGYPAINTLKCFTFNYYTLYVFMGIWIGLQVPEFLPKADTRHRLGERNLWRPLHRSATARSDPPSRDLAPMTCHSSHRLLVKWWSSSDCSAWSAIFGQSGSSCY